MALLTLFRSFSLVSAAVVAAAVILAPVGYGRLARAWLVQTIEANTVAVGLSVTRAFGAELTTYLNTANALKGDAIQQHPAAPAMRGAIVERLQDFPIVGWTLYDTSGRAVLSTDPALSGRDEGSLAPMASALAGAASSAFVRRNGAGNPDPVASASNMLESFVPFRPSRAGSVIGVISLRADLTPQMRSIHLAQRNLVLAVLLGCATIIASMYAVMRRAASVAQVQIAQNAALAERLRLNEQMLAQAHGEEAEATRVAVDAARAVSMRASQPEPGIAVPMLIDERANGGAERPLLVALPNRSVAMDRAQQRAALNQDSRGAIGSELRAALERGELLLHFQPILRLADRRIVGAEVLVRWEHANRGLLLPADFLPLAEESGLIGPIGDWVLERACQVAGTWARVASEPLFISVNISARQFDDTRSLNESIQRAIARGNLPPCLLELEITEALLTRDSDETLQLLKDLRATGIRLSAQDFGRSFSNLRHLKRYPLTTLKIDGSFVRNFSVSNDDAAVVSALMSMARGLELSVTAQGIESDAQVAELCAIGCASGQGFALGRPMTADDFFRMLLTAEISRSEQATDDAADAANERSHSPETDRAALELAPPKIAAAGGM